MNGSRLSSYQINRNDMFEVEYHGYVMLFASFNEAKNFCIPRKVTTISNRVTNETYDITDDITIWLLGKDNA